MGQSPQTWQLLYPLSKRYLTKPVKLESSATCAQIPLPSCLKISRPINGNYSYQMACNYMKVLRPGSNTKLTGVLAHASKRSTCSLMAPPGLMPSTRLRGQSLLSGKEPPKSTGLAILLTSCGFQIPWIRPPPGSRGRMCRHVHSTSHDLGCETIQRCHPL